MRASVHVNTIILTQLLRSGNYERIQAWLRKFSTTVSKPQQI